MKKFGIKVLLFACLLLITDQLIGLGADWLRRHARGGNVLRENYISDHTTADLLIMGSSRAVHHYVPKILRDSLGMEAYNAGQDGCGIVYGYGKFCSFRNRYVPKILLWEFTPNFDIACSDNAQFLPLLRPYYDYPGVDSVFLWVNPAERFKMYSRTYRYNSRIFNLLNDFRQENTLPKDGYMPNPGQMNYEPDITEPDTVLQPDPVKLHCMKQLIAATRGRCKLIVLMSPRYLPQGYKGRTQHPAIEYMKNLCKQEGIPFLDHYNDPNFIGRKELFKDPMHLNTQGSEVYTRLIAKELKRQIP